MEYIHFTQSSNALREATALITGEVLSTFSASMQAGAKRAYSFLPAKYEKFVSLCYGLSLAIVYFVTFYGLTNIIYSSIILLGGHMIGKFSI